MSVLSKERHDEMPLKNKLQSESIRVINYQREQHHQRFNNVCNQTAVRLTSVSERRRRLEQRPPMFLHSMSKITAIFLLVVVPGQNIIVIFIYLYL